MAQLMPLPLTVACFSKIQIGFTFLVAAHPVVPEKGPLNARARVCVMSVFFLTSNWMAQQTRSCSLTCNQGIALQRLWASCSHLLREKKKLTAQPDLNPVLWAVRLVKPL